MTMLHLAIALAIGVILLSFPIGRVIVLVIVVVFGGILAYGWQQSEEKDRREHADAATLHADAARLCGSDFLVATDDPVTKECFNSLRQAEDNSYVKNQCGNNYYSYGEPHPKGWTLCIARTYLSVCQAKYPEYCKALAERLNQIKDDPASEDTVIPEPAPAAPQSGHWTPVDPGPAPATTTTPAPANVTQSDPAPVTPTADPSVTQAQPPGWERLTCTIQDNKGNDLVWRFEPNDQQFSGASHGLTEVSYTKNGQWYDSKSQHWAWSPASGDTDNTLSMLPDQSWKIAYSAPHATLWHGKNIVGHGQCSAG
jgi:hypothetical protein